jgi:hypothetical protein
MRGVTEYVLYRITLTAFDGPGIALCSYNRYRSRLDWKLRNDECEPDLFAHVVRQNDLKNR